jgi:hypothetical protein
MIVPFSVQTRDAIEPLLTVPAVAVNVLPAMPLEGLTLGCFVNDGAGVAVAADTLTVCTADCAVPPEPDAVS